MVSYYYPIVTFFRKTIKVFEIFDFKNAVTFKIGSRSLKLSPFDREPMTSNKCSRVTMTLSCVVSEIFNVEKYRDLEIPDDSQSRSLKVVPFVRLVMIFY